MSSNSNWTEFGGRGRIRVREAHVRDHLAPLVSAGAAGIVKLDLVLRGLASTGEDGEQPGRVPPELTWADLHDMVRDPAFYSGDLGLKRKWVSEKLMRLEAEGLLRRQLRRGARSALVVLRDDASGRPFDEPDGSEGNSYVTLLGSLVEYGRVVHWGSPQLAACIAAMIAERYARSDQRFAEVAALEDRPFGGGLWYRSLSWFADPENRRPEQHVRIPFSARTLRRGVTELKAEGLMATEWIHDDPRTGRKFPNGPRVLYHNGFDDVRPGRRLRVIPGRALMR